MDPYDEVCRLLGVKVMEVEALNRAIKRLSDVAREAEVQCSIERNQASAIQSRREALAESFASIIALLSNAMPPREGRVKQEDLAILREAMGGALREAMRALETRCDVPF